MHSRVGYIHADMQQETCLFLTNKNGKTHKRSNRGCHNWNMGESSVTQVGCHRSVGLKSRSKFTTALSVVVMSYCHGISKRHISMVSEASCPLLVDHFVGPHMPTPKTDHLYLEVKHRFPPAVYSCRFSVVASEDRHAASQHEHERSTHVTWRTSCPGISGPEEVRLLGADRAVCYVSDADFQQEEWYIHHL